MDNLPKTPVDLETTAISDEQVEKLWEAFKVFDEDGNGGISVEELGRVMRSLGQSPDNTDLRDTIKEVDVDLSGTIDFQEFKAQKSSKLLFLFKVGNPN